MLLLPLPSEIFILESPAVASILPPTPSRLTVIKPFDVMRSLSVELFPDANKILSYPLNDKSSLSPKENPPPAPTKC